MTERRPAGSPRSGDKGRRNRTRRIVAGALAVIGGVLAIVSFSGVPWGEGFSFWDHGHELNAGVGGLGDAAASSDLSVAYFPWLAFVLLAGVVVFGLLAATRPHPRSRVIGCLLGVGGTVLSFFAWYEETPGVRPGLGVLLAMAGFLLAAVGAASGPRRGTAPEGGRIVAGAVAATRPPSATWPALPRSGPGVPWWMFVVPAFLVFALIGLALAFSVGGGGGGGDHQFDQLNDQSNGPTSSDASPLPDLDARVPRVPFGKTARLTAGNDPIVAGGSDPPALVAGRSFDLTLLHLRKARESREPGIDYALELRVCAADTNSIDPESATVQLELLTYTKAYESLSPSFPSVQTIPPVLKAGKCANGSVKFLDLPNGTVAVAVGAQIFPKEGTPVVWTLPHAE